MTLSVRMAYTFYGKPVYHINGYIRGNLNYSAPVVQSIVSLRKSLIKDSLRFLEHIKSIALIFLTEQLRGTVASSRIIRLNFFTTSLKRKERKKNKINILYLFASRTG